MAITEIGAQYKDRVSGVFQETLGMSKAGADALVEDGEISGAELWSHFLELQAITRRCGTDGRCYNSYTRKLFNEIEKDFSKAAGENIIIDGQAEVDQLKVDVQRRLAAVGGQSFKDTVGQAYGVDGRLLSAEEIFASRKVPKSEIPNMLRSTLDSPQFYKRATKNESVPNTVVLFAYLPVTINKAFDFLVRTADEFDDRTTLYDETHITTGRRASLAETQGYFETSVTIDVPYNASEPSFKAGNYWTRLGSDFGQNADAFLYRFGLVPGSPVSDWGLEVTAMEGVVMARPTSEGGTVVEFHLDFDFNFIPDWLLDLLMAGEVKKFVEELSKALSRSDNNGAAP